METFLTVLLFIFIGFWLLGVIGRWLLRGWLMKKQRQFEQQFGQGAGSQNAGAGGFRGFYTTFGGRPSGNGRTSARPEGEVTIDKESAQNERNVSKQVGEYVEYEEEISER